MVCRYGRTVALEDVTLSLERGEWLYVMGPSASGKTTLLRAIAGLQPLASGEIRIGGNFASNSRVAIPPHERQLALLFQGPSLWPHLNVEANVALGVNGSLTRSERRAATADWIDRLGLREIAKRFPAELSGGEARTVELARALASRPRLLLLDEPTAHLDMHLRESLLSRIRSLHSELQLTTICVTHQLEQPMQDSDRLVVFERGRLIYDNPISTIANAPESPFTLALRRAAAALDVKYADESK